MVTQCPKYPDELTVGLQRALLIHAGGGNVERPPILIDRLHPAGRTDINTFIPEPAEQTPPVANFMVYQRDCIHLNTPSGLWLTASNIALASASGLVSTYRENSFQSFTTPQ